MLTPSEPLLTPRTYAFLAKLVHERSRIHLGPDRQALVAGRLGRRIKALGLPDYETYCRLLESPGAEDEVEHLIDLIATNHTHFFREPGHFQILDERLLPRLADRLGRADRPLLAWSAAASSGEEAYSLAITLAEFGQRHPQLAWQVHASDISTRMLDRCRSGIYEADKVTLPDARLLPRYFLRGFGQREGYCRVRPEIRRRVLAQHVNLFQASYPFAAAFDLIFCRNAMIYFDPASRQELLDRLVAMLQPGGLLFVGHAESLIGMRHPLRAEGPGVHVLPT